MEFLLEILDDIEIGHLIAMGLMLWFFYSRLDSKIDKVDAKIDRVENIFLP